MSPSRSVCFGRTVAAAPCGRGRSGCRRRALSPSAGAVLPLARPRAPHMQHRLCSVFLMHTCTRMHTHTQEHTHKPQTCTCTRIHTHRTAHAQEHAHTRIHTKTHTQEPTQEHTQNTGRSGRCGRFGSPRPLGDGVAGVCLCLSTLGGTWGPWVMSVHQLSLSKPKNK